MNDTEAASEEHRHAQRALLEGVRQGHDVRALQRAVRQTATKSFTPDVAMLELAALAMDTAGIDRTAPLPKSDMTNRHLLEINFRNQRALQERTTYAINVCAAIRGGLDPDILDDTYWWGTRDIVEYAVTAAVAYVRACAERTGMPVAAFADQLRSLVETSD